MRSNVALSAAALLGLLAQVSTAASCTSSNAYPIEDYIASTGGGGGGSGGAGAEIFLSEDIIGNAVSNSVKKRNPRIPANRTPDAKLANMVYAIRQRRADDKGVTCSVSETCLSVQKAPFCLDIISGAFHDSTGTTGNALTGDYVLGDGRKGNLYNGPHPLPSGASNAQTTPTPTGSGGGAQETGPAAGGNGNGNGGGNAPPPAQTGSPLPKENAASGREMVVGGVVIGGLMAVVGAELL
ncbi:hypothetical protein V8F33_003511 [Rhypophila sp. PSN 637]